MVKPEQPTKATWLRCVGRLLVDQPVTPEQRLELQRLLNEAEETRKARRDIQFNLKADIDRLGAWIKFFNIAFVPILVAGFAILLSIKRRREARVRAEAGGAS